MRDERWEMRDERWSMKDGVVRVDVDVGYCRRSVGWVGLEWVEVDGTGLGCMVYL